MFWAPAVGKQALESWHTELVYVGAGVADVGVTGTGFLSSSFEQENKIIDKRAYFMVNFILISLNLQVNKLCFFCVKYSCQ